MRRPDPFELRELLGPRVAVARRAMTGERGVALPPFIDHHVHLHLIDEQLLAAGGITGVVDLGGDPVELARRLPDGIPRVSYAGAFLTAPGGYPAGRSWAPAAIVREITDASPHAGAHGGAGTAVDEQATFGASIIKVALNAAAGPVFDGETLGAIVARAHERGLQVVAHVEGEGMTERAVDAGVDALAHTPFTEALDADLVARAVRAGQRWISTLDIHRSDPGARVLALANLSAFVAAGGTVLYGTDLGNGDLPVGVNVREIEALASCGLNGESLIEVLTDPWPASSPTTAVATFVAGEVPSRMGEMPTWLGAATVVPTEELIHDEH